MRRKMTHDEVVAEWRAAEKRESLAFEDRMGNVITELGRQRDESIQERICKLETRIEVLEAEQQSRWVPHLSDRIKHLESVVYEEGPPPSASMLENVQ